MIFWKWISTVPARNLKARDARPLVSERNLFGISKIEIKKFQVRDFFGKGFPRRPWGTLRLGMGALWYANWIYLGILESQSKVFRSVIFWKGISAALMRNLEARDGRALVSEQSLCRSFFNPIQKFPGPWFFWKGFPRRQQRTLKLGLGALW